ncbi:MAG: hypothetical protein WD071_15725 [Pseudohongiella sp.]|uniref:hypothetical protein n=1 Tax=Pseudohongiella sp. TaxID=1979412 RepID=UPI0034A0A081
MQLKTIGSVVAAWLLAVLTATVLGSIIQTQFNMAAIANLDVTIPVGTWLMATVQDIFNFGLLYGLLVAIALAVGFAVAALLTGRFAERLALPRIPMFVLAGAVAVLVLLLTLNAVLPMTPIAATRNTAALVLMALAGAPAGWVYSRFRARKSGGSHV